MPPKLLPKSQREAWNREFPSYALVNLSAQKPAPPSGQRH
jgi:hypothetical protein